MKYVIAAILICCSCLVGSPSVGRAESDPGLAKVSLQLKWKHQFQFAGYYAALEQGYYRDAGLDVEIRGRKIGSERPVDQVLDGAATYGVEGANLLVRRMQGEPLVALAAIFQHSPLVLLARRESRINTAKDIAGKRLMDYGPAEVGLPAMLMQEGIDPAAVNRVPMSYNLDSLINGETDLYSAYLTNEPYFLKQRQIPYTVINPVNYGIVFYSDILFTTEQELIEHPRRVMAFRAASLKGWKYALEHPKETVDLILAKYSQRKTREHLLFEATETAKLVRPDVTPIGHINQGRIKHMALVLQKLGRAEKITNLDGFIYDRNLGIQFSAREMAWLAKHKKIRVRIADVPPLIFIEDGRPRGIAAEYLDLIAQKTGIEFEYLAESRSWADALQALIHHDGLDLVPAIKPTPERRKQLALTDSYVQMPSVIFTREAEEKVHALEDLAGLKVAVVKGYKAHDYLRRDYPRLELRPVGTVRAALKSLATGEADAYVGSLLTAAYGIREQGLGNIKVAAPVSYESSDMAMGVRSDWPELASIINQVLRSMSLEERRNIRTKWSNITFETGISITKVLYWGAGILAALALGFWAFWLWSWRLKQEIGRRKTTEKALVDSVQQYQHLIQAIPHGIIELDRNLLITYCNRPFAAILDLEPSALSGAALADSIGSDRSFRDLQQMLETIRQGGDHGSLQLQLLDSRQKQHKVRFDLGFAGRVASESQIIIVTDLTRQEETEKALQKSEAVYRSTFEHIQAGVAHLAIDGRITRANSYMCRMLGYSVDELLTLDLFQITHPEDLSLSKDKLQQLREAGQGAYSLAKRYLKKDGSPIWGLISVSLMQPQDGEDCYIVVVQDIDDFKHQQDQVAETSQNLERIIAQRTLELRQRVIEVEELNTAMLNLAEDLRRSNQQLELKSEEVNESNRDLESFAYSVSHDLRAPLRHISGFASVLQERTDARFDDTARQQLEKIMASAEKMGKMIDDLLSFSRAGRTELMLAPVDMNLLFQEARRDVDEDYRSPLIDWQIGSLPQVQGDVTTLRQVVINLLDNAAKYSAKEKEPRIEVDAHQLDGEIVFRIRDNGVGFDPAYAEKLFNVFQRLHRDDEFSGTGIGLASVRRIMLRHGGWVKGESVPGQGACFSFGLKAPQGETP